MDILKALGLLTGGSVVPLVDLLRRAGDKAPDLKAGLDGWITKLESAADPANLVRLAPVVKAEIQKAIKEGRLDPRDHPGDAI